MAECADRPQTERDPFVNGIVLVEEHQWRGQGKRRLRQVLWAEVATCTFDVRVDKIVVRLKRGEQRVAGG